MKRIYKIYNKLNKRYFGNQLDFVEIKFKRLKGVYGYCTDYGEFREIEIAKGLCNKIMRDTLLHEMIHVWQAQEGMPMNHKKDFRKWIKIVGKHIA